MTVPPQRGRETALLTAGCVTPGTFREMDFLTVAGPTGAFYAPACYRAWKPFLTGKRANSVQKHLPG
jgi:hypothetical protein